MKNRLLLLLLLAGILAACEEDKLTPSDPQEFYEFPQGNADYDQEFVAFYEKYNTQFLYKYREADFRWNVTEYIPYYSVPANEAYVGKAYRLIKEKCLDAWGETFYKDMLPLRILLASEVYNWESKDNWVRDPETGESVNQKYNDTTWYATAYGLNHVTFGCTSDKLDNLTPKEQLNLIGDM
ncbi:MAG: putative zinc-binding metallopeptidase, partial [Odoribacter sp.]|nr:putative zinc-binding metallopeptidase [Odoribacter sp.]